MITTRKAWRAAVAAALLFGCAPATQSPAQPARKDQNANRLIRESSPYLLQHAHNPVDWYPWGAEAFERAKRENKPIFLSVGYAACHWCHVMERESFEDEEVARALNAAFVCVKVDREERPDVDEAYMTAVQLLTQRGGWPMSVWLTPDGRPFFGGTYYPPDELKALIGRIREAWSGRRPEVERSAATITAAVRTRLRESTPAHLPTESNLKTLIDSLCDDYDPVHGGFGGAPKFPPHTGFPLLFHAYERSRDPKLLQPALGTLDAMARGGIRDHLAGGFHRYSTDDAWLVPHFEKMLYDNALLARAYTDAFRLTNRPQYAQVARETLEWALREMCGPEGAFYSSMDADSDGQEGRYYLWKRSEVVSLLGSGKQAGDLFCGVYNVREQGNYVEQATGHHNGLNILYPKAPLDELARRRGEQGKQFLATLAEMRARLLAERDKRARPSVDDKRLTAWNALIIGSLAHAGRALREPRYTAAATKCADFLLANLWKEGRLAHSWRPAGATGQAQLSGAGFLEDYAGLADALIELYGATGRERWLVRAKEVADAMISRFAEPAGGFFDTAADIDSPLVRGRNVLDHATPSGNATAGLVLTRLARLTGDRLYRQRAKELLTAFGVNLTRAPRAAQGLALAASVYLDDEPHPQAAETPAPADSAVRGPVRVSAAADNGMPGGRVKLTVRIVVDKGWHVNASSPGVASLIGTKVEVLDTKGVQAEAPLYPAGKPLRAGYAEQPIQTYQGEVKVAVPLRIARDAPGRIYLPVRVRFQACDDRTCLAPETVTVRARLLVILR